MNTASFRFVFSCLVFVLSSILLAGCAISPAPISDNSGNYELAILLEDIRQKEKLPAIASAIIIDGDIYAKAAVGIRKYGTDNWVTVDDKFLIGSCGKAFTATLAAILIDEGLLRWETSAREVFPEMRMHPEWENITIRQLLSNRSGYVDDMNTHVLPWEDLQEVWDLDRPPAYLRLEYSKRAVLRKPIHPPDKVIIYANSGFLVAGAMLETATGKTFEKLMDEKLFQALELKNAGYGAPASLDPVSQPFGHKKGLPYMPIEKDLPDFIAPMGNVAISIGDWSSFILFHLNARQVKDMGVLAPATVEMMHTPPNPAHWNYTLASDGSLRAFDEFDASTINYALGWFTEERADGNTLIGHKGQGKSFTAVVHADPESKNAILLVTNAKVSQMHLQRAAEAIKAHYAAKADLPIVTMPTAGVWR
jgi:CubicO group peptidase (beta-lactamase class C family)